MFSEIFRNLSNSRAKASKNLLQTARSWSHGGATDVQQRFAKNIVELFQQLYCKKEHKLGVRPSGAPHAAQAADSFEQSVPALKTAQLVEEVCNAIPR